MYAIYLYWVYIVFILGFEGSLRLRLMANVPGNFTSDRGSWLLLITVIHNYSYQISLNNYNGSTSYHRSFITSRSVKIDYSNFISR